MRVLQINSVCGYGSTGNIAVDLYRELKKQGHECCIAYGRGTAPDKVESYRIGSDLDVYVHGVVSRLTDRHGFYSTHATRKFVKWMKEYNPDVIHLHNLHGYYINIEVLFEALKQMDKPVIWTLHDCWAFTGHCAHFDYAGCDKWKIQCEKCPQKKEYPVSLWMDNSYDNYRRKKKAFCLLNQMTIVTPSQWLADLVKESFLQKYDVKVIHNGIDLHVFRPIDRDIKREYHLEDKKIILGVASEWSRSKGLQDFVRLADMIDREWQIVLIGHIAGAKTQKRNITYIARTSDREELTAWYTAANVFFNPTYQDTFPTVNLEAQACGTPVITYDTGGSPEGVTEGCGKVVNGGDIKKVAEYVKEVLMPNMIASQFFSKSLMNQAYIAEYANLRFREG